MSTKTSSRLSKIPKKVKLATGRSKSYKEDGEAPDSKRKGFRGNKNGRMSLDDAVDVPFRDKKMYKKENGERKDVRSTAKYKPVYGETLDSKKKGFRGNKNARLSLEDAVDVPFNDNKWNKKENNERRNVKLITKNKPFYEQNGGGERGYEQMNNDQKRKRVYADRDNSNDGVFHDNVETPFRKVFSKGRNEVKYDVTKEKRSMREKSRDFEELEKEKVIKRGRKTHETESLDNNGRKKLRLKLKAADKMDYGKMDRGGNSTMRNDAKITSDRKQLEQNNKRHTADSPGKSLKKKVNDKKSVGDDLAEDDERPKKIKKAMRIDPRDTTNKRLDDGVLPIGLTKEKKEDTKKNESVEMSKNAQFRAIKPSPSILSFVEDNLLGRRRLIELRRAGYNTELSAPLDNIPFSTSLERERIEEPIFRNKLTFFAAANISSSFPPPDLPEIAFAGRSNVGKSSLLNALTRQWGVVRTSDKPGLTQTINFFQLESKLCLVDLPGYGFAYAKEEVKEAWEELVKEYVSTRVGLKRVCLLIDTKWGMKPRDHELIDLMESSQTKYQIVLTKTDLVFPIDVARRAMQIEESLKAKKSAVQPVMMASSKSGAGIRSLRTVLTKIARFAKL